MQRFGKAKLNDYNVHIYRTCVEIGVEIETYQSNDAAELATFMDKKGQFSSDCANGIVIAPGLFTTEAGNPLVAAIERAVAKGIPVYEVHIGNFGQHKAVSSIGHAVTAQICGCVHWKPARHTPLSPLFRLSPRRSSLRCTPPRLLSAAPASPLPSALISFPTMPSSCRCLDWQLYFGNFIVSVVPFSALD